MIKRRLLRQQRASRAERLQGLTRRRQDHEISLPPFFQTTPMLVKPHERAGLRAANWALTQDWRR
jgi:hypothetical protein